MSDPNDEPEGKIVDQSEFEFMNHQLTHEQLKGKHKLR